MTRSWWLEDVFRRVSEGETPMAAAQASVTRLAPVLAAISLNPRGGVPAFGFPCPA